jgi:hypothetical protein
MKKLTEQQEKTYAETTSVVRFMNMVQQAKEALPALAAELNANEYYTSFSIEQERDSKDIEFSCNIHCTFGKWSNYHCGSYINEKHDFDAAADSIREMHAKWQKEEDARQRKREEERIKAALYEDYKAQLSSTPF